MAKVKVLKQGIPVVIKGRGVVAISKNNATILKSFTKDNWEYFMHNIDFADDELKIIEYIRRDWLQINIAEELRVSEITIKRKYKKILNKIDKFIILKDIPIFKNFLKLK